MRRVAPDQRFPTLTPVGIAPVLSVIDDFATSEECTDAMALFGDEAWVTEHANHYGWDGASFAAEVDADHAPLLLALADRMEALAGEQSRLPRTWRFRWYDVGQGHPPHTDTYDFEGFRLMITGLLFLQETEAGGETRFPAALPEPLAVAPRTGRLILWRSTRSDGEEDPASLHDGAAVIAGSKGVLLGFIYLPVEASG